MPRYPFTRDFAGSAPDEPGVYGLFEGTELVYIGRAPDRQNSLKACLRNHRDGVHGDCTRRATACTWEVARFPRAREREILEAFRETNRREPRCQRRAA